MAVNTGMTSTAAEPAPTGAELPGGRCRSSLARPLILYRFHGHRFTAGGATGTARHFGLTGPLRGTTMDDCPDARCSLLAPLSVPHRHSTTAVTSQRTVTDFERSWAAIRARGVDSLFAAVIRLHGRFSTASNGGSAAPTQAPLLLQTTPPHIFCPKFRPVHRYRLDGPSDFIHLLSSS